MEAGDRLGHGRSRKQIKIDQEKLYDDMETQKVSRSAEEAFRRPAYAILNVTEYLAKKYNIRKGESIG